MMASLGFLWTREELDKLPDGTLVTVTVVAALEVVARAEVVLEALKVIPWKKKKKRKRFEYICELSKKKWDAQLHDTNYHQC